MLSRYKENRIWQGKTLLKNNDFGTAEEIFYQLIKSGETDPEILELHGDSLHGQEREGYAQKCYRDALELIMVDVFDNIQSSTKFDNLKSNYEKLYLKLEEIDVRLYPTFDELVLRISSNEHPRLLSDLKLKLQNPKFELNYCGDYYTVKRDYEKHSLDELSTQIYKNKTNNVSSIISRKMFEFIQKNMDVNMDLVIPVPNHISDNPWVCKGVSLALSLSKLLGKSCVTNVLEKIEESDVTRKDSGKYHREQTAEKQYEITNNSQIINKKILLVDDVLVTGATVKKCAKLLIENGARHVDIICAGKSFYNVSVEKHSDL